jgi:hypothetical protein
MVHKVVVAVLTEQEDRLLEVFLAVLLELLA